MTTGRERPRAARLAADPARRGGGRGQAVTAAAGAMRQLWLDGAASARSAGRDPVMVPDVVWPLLADAALTAAVPLLTPSCRHALAPAAGPAPQGRNLAAALPGDPVAELTADAVRLRGELGAALRDRDAVTAALSDVLDQLAAASRLSDCLDAAADAAELLDDLAADDAAPPAARAA